MEGETQPAVPAEIAPLEKKDEFMASQDSIPSSQAAQGPSLEAAEEAQGAQQEAQIDANENSQQSTTSKENSLPQIRLLYSECRRSGRARTAPKMFVPEQIPPRPKRKPTKTSVNGKEDVAKGNAAKDSKSAVKSKSSSAANKSNGKSGDSKAKPEGKADGKSNNKSNAKADGKSASSNKSKAPPAPKMLVKVGYRSSVLPSFEPVPLECSEEIFWLRMNLREFLLRFDKLCRLPTRHAATINDPSQEWNDYLFKAAIVALYRLIENDTTPIYSFARYYLAETEHTQAESPQIWELLEEFLLQTDPYFENSNALEGEHRRLDLVRRLLVITMGTETIRLTLGNDVEEVRLLQAENLDQIKALKDQLAANLEKIERLQAQDKVLYEERKAALEKTNADRIYKVKQGAYFQIRKYTPRTQALGPDTLGNMYWSFQHKRQDTGLWSTSVLCLLKRLPEDFIKGQETLSLAIAEAAAAPPKKKRVRKKPEDTKLEAGKTPNKAPEKSTTSVAHTAIDTQNVKAEPALMPSDLDVEASKEKSELNGIERADPEHSSKNDAPKGGTGTDLKPAGDLKKEDHEQEPKPRKKRKLSMPERCENMKVVSGKDNILNLAIWIGSQPGQKDPRLVSELEDLANYIIE